MAEDAPPPASGQVTGGEESTPAVPEPVTTSQSPIPPSIDEIQAAHVRGEITNDDMRKAQAGEPVSLPEVQEPEKPAPVEEAPRKISKEEALDVLAALDAKDLTHDELKRVRAYNETLNRSISQNKAEQARAAEMGAWADFIDKLTPEQFASIQKDDAVAAQATNGTMDAAAMRKQFDAVLAWRASGQMMRTGAYKVAADSIRDEIEQYLVELTDYPALAKEMPKIKEFAGDSGAKLFARAIEVAAADTIRSETAKIKAEYEAKLNEAKAEFHTETGSPDLIPGGSAVNGKSYSSLQELEAAHAHREIDNNTFRRLVAAFA